VWHQNPRLEDAAEGVGQGLFFRGQNARPCHASFGVADARAAVSFGVIKQRCPPLALMAIKLNLTLMWMPGWPGNVIHVVRFQPGRKCSDARAKLTHWLAPGFALNLYRLQRPIALYMTDGPENSASATATTDDMVKVSWNPLPSPD
jgi:hypothetical protein